MKRYYDSRFEELRDLLLRMSYLSVENFLRALQGLFGRDTELCEQVVREDSEIDQLELRIDKLCQELLLTLQPVAKDLRFVTMSMRINTNLERVGDQAVYIARVGCDLAKLPPMPNLFGLPDLGLRAKTAVLQSIEAYIQEDVELARRIRAGDAGINRTHREMIQKLLVHMMENPSQVAQAIELVFLAQSLERVADYGKNIADEVIYLVEAVDPRHQKEAG
ncbi:MAG: phosphate signaling complex protein PhoU [Candidatus Eisenbacteria bacterium]|nr:phosphate signaling complex protein PhoU [Candidatus Eisenbacteria bacterium]